MTEQPTRPDDRAPAPEQEAPPTADDPTPAADATATAPPETPNAEAARYRVRLREVESARDGLAERLERMQRAEVERIAADRLANPEDLWLVRPDLGELLDDDGNVDAERVTAAVDAVVAERPGWRAQRIPSFDGGVRGTPPRIRPSWAEVLTDSRRRTG